MNPVLTIVIAARNDNYGGDFDARLQNTLAWNCFHLERKKILSEIILVNYNPIPSEKPLEKKLKAPPERSYTSVRIITANELVHKTYDNETLRLKIPFYEFIAKNIGIRRAKGQFILSMNADILLPESVFEFVAKGKLNMSYFYRADRADFYSFDMNSISRQQLIRECQKHTFKYFMKGFKYDFSVVIPFKVFVLWLKIFNSIRLRFHLFKTKHKNFFAKFNIPAVTDNAEFIFHTHNSGDFLLMHREYWFNLRGNPEKTFISTHADASMVVMAATSGLKEYIFFEPVFHQHHERRFGWKEIEENELFKKEYLRFQSEAQKMLKENKPYIFNDNNWGYGTAELSEILL